MTQEEPEAPLTRAGVALVLGGVLVGLSLSGTVGRGSISEALLIAGCLIVAGGVVATLRSLYDHWKDRRQ